MDIKRRWNEVQAGQTVRTTEGKVGIKIEQIGILTQELKLLYVYDTEPVELITDINQCLYFLKGNRVLQADS